MEIMAISMTTSPQQGRDWEGLAYQQNLTLAYLIFGALPCRSRRKCPVSRTPRKRARGYGASSGARWSRGSGGRRRRFKWPTLSSPSFPTGKVGTLDSRPGSRRRSVLTVRNRFRGGEVPRARSGRHQLPHPPRRVQVRADGRRPREALPHRRRTQVGPRERPIRLPR